MNLRKNGKLICLLNWLKSSKNRTNLLEIPIRLSGCTPPCTSLCSKTTSARRNTVTTQVSPPRNLWISATRTLLPSFSSKTGKEKTLSSPNLEISMSACTATPTNSTMPSDSSSTPKTAQEFNSKSSWKKCPTKALTSRLTTSPSSNFLLTDSAWSYR